MLPSRSTLQSWDPDALSASGGAVDSSGTSVGAAVSGIDDAVNRLPEVKGWSGDAHDAATGMFGRADIKAQQFTDYAKAVAAALKNGANTIGGARAALLAKADQVDAGPLNVTDQWVVLIDPMMTSEEEMAKLQALAMQEQGEINTMLGAVGDADNATADAIIAAGKEAGFVEPGPPADLGGLLLPTAQRPPDQVPDPRNPLGLAGQEAIRAADQQQHIREVVYSTNRYGEEVTTVIKQDGSKAITTRMDPFEWPSKQNFFQMEEFDKNGDFIARTSSWHDLGNDCDYTTIAYADGSHLTMSMDPTGYRTAGFTTPDGRHSAVPVELIDNLSIATTTGMGGLEKHIARGGSLPMLTAESVDNIGKAMKFGGPALSAATTVFDMVMAESGKDRCIALVAGVAGGSGGWAMAEAGAAIGVLGGPLAPLTVPLGAVVLGGFGAAGGMEMGKFIGEVVCPY
ncbi:hypothetical protein ACTWP6_26480 [Mycobacterium sp. 4D054]|uniref:hypothetical protein n=1 Tax=Mycobacterium sp. 4D054 TaxID=3457440 RepID=UPI003FD1DE18